MTNVVSRAEYEIKRHILTLLDMIDSRNSLGVVLIDHLLRCRVSQLLVIRRQQDGALRIGGIADLTLGNRGIYLIHEARLVDGRERLVSPVVDRIASLVGDIVDDDTALIAKGCSLIIIISIAVGLDLAQRHPTMRGSRDGERDVHRLGISVGRAGIGRDILVVDVDRALDIPVVSLRIGRIGLDVGIDVRIAVVDNLLGVVDEVTRSLHLFQIRFIAISICESLIGTGRKVVGRQVHFLPIPVPGLDTVLVTGIDIAATKTSLHVDEVEFDNAGDEPPLGLARLFTLLADNFQIDARCQADLVRTGGIVAVGLACMAHLPVIVGAAILLIAWIGTVGGTDRGIA